MTVVTTRKVFSVHGGRSIMLNTGETLLIGKPRLFEPEFREAITEDRKYHTERTIRNIQRLSHKGVDICNQLHKEAFGYMSGVLTHQGIIDVVLRAVRSGQLLAFVLPPVSGADCVADPKRLENLSGGLVGASAVNPEIADSNDVTFNDLKGMEDKLIYVLKRAPHFITSAKVKKALKEGLSAAAIISVVVVLVAWAASHFFGVGFAIDAILLAIGFVMIGWAIFGAMKKLLKCLKLVKNAESLSDLDKAAEMMADAIVALGVETLISLLTRGAGRMKAKSSGGSGAGAGNGKPRTQKDIEADNKAKADASKKKEDQGKSKSKSYTDLQPLQRQYVDEEFGKAKGLPPGHKVKYLNANERADYKLTIKDGKLYDAKGKLFDTRGAKSLHRSGTDKAIFVMDKNGNIFASNKHELGKFHHSSFLAGKPVASAGELTVRNGILHEVTSRSGHYRPTSNQTQQFINNLTTQKTNLSKFSLSKGF